MNNNYENLPEADDRECRARRNALIHIGIITPGKEKNAKRAALIEQGLIDPNFCEMPKIERIKCDKEEGEYNPQPIRTPEEYYRRRQAYFRMLQEILRSRIELKLNLGGRGDGEWSF